MNMIECLGMDVLTEDEESFYGFVQDICAESKAIMGYHLHPYLNREYGWAQFIVRAEVNEEEKRLDFLGLDTHLSGVTVWDVLLSDMEFQPKDADVLTRRAVVKRASDGGGLAVVNLVNADVLPSFLPNDRIKMQVVAFPEEIRYYPDEDAYASDQPESANGQKWLLADGSMVAGGILKNHTLDNPEKDQDHYSDNYMLIRSTVKKVRRGYVKLGEEEFSPFITVLIGTEHGDLEIVHTIDQVAEEEREFIREGATVNGVFILSGDVAIYEYSDGIVRDEAHNLALLRYTLQKGDPVRMRSVLREDAVYVSEASQKEFIGRNSIIERLQYVRDSNPDTNYFAHMATITSIDDGEEMLPYQVGQRCVIVAENEPDNYTSVAFLEHDGEDFITKLTISTNSRYHFQIEVPVKPRNILDDFELPVSAAKQILSRAHFHGFLDRETEDEAVLGCLTHIKTYESNAQQMLKALDNYPDVEADEKYRNTFGYLFAKAIEYDQSWRHGYNDPSLLEVNYSPRDAVAGELYTNLSPKAEAKVQIAHDYGKQFYKDLHFFCSVHEECDFAEELLKALVVVQQIGEVYSQTKLDAWLEKEK